MSEDELEATLHRIASRETGKFWAGSPERWFVEGPRWRCANDHVSSRYLKDEERGCVCLACFEPLYLTFPEDQDGPLVEHAV